MPPQATSPIPSLQVPSLTADDLKDPSAINAAFLNVTQMLNYILGHGGGPPVLKAGVDLGGANITNSGAPQSPSDVVSLEFANANYGAPAIAPALEALSKSGSFLQTYRQLNNPVQRERSSSFLNDLQSTPATSNTATLSYTTVGSTADVTVSGGLQQYTDGSSAPFASRTDTLPLPASFGTSSLSRSGDIVTVDTTAPTAIAVDDQVGIAGQSDPSFQGVFLVLTTPTSSQFTYYQAGPNATTSGGGGSLLSAYYYVRSKGQNQLGLVASPSADTWSARTPASIDGTTIVAVVVLTSNGVDPLNSAAGSSVPQSGAAVPVIRRL